MHSTLVSRSNSYHLDKLLEPIFTKYARADPRIAQTQTRAVQNFTDTVRESKQTTIGKPPDWSAITVYVLNGAGVSGEGVQADSRQTGSEQKQRSEAEGRSGYLGRDVGNRSVTGRV